MAIERVLTPPSDSYFLLGPYGTGKSTWASACHPNALLINLLKPETLRILRARPEELLNLVRPLAPGRPVIIDEIQKVPELLSLVHLLIEQDPHRQFILTGSSARRLRQQGVNLLGGRALRRLMHPFMACELGDQFDPKQALRYGLLPLCYFHANPHDKLQAYVHLYLEEEIKAEGLVRHIEPFALFLETLSFSHGATINASNIARECALKRSTVDNWLEIVRDMLICFEIPVFSRRAKRQLTRKAKFYFFDTGVYRALRPTAMGDLPKEMDGLALEGLVAQHLKAWCDTSTGRHKLNYWHTKSGLEVDFVILGDLGFWAIEVKHTHNPNPKDLHGLKAFVQDYPEATPLIVYQGDMARSIDGILCLPWTSFLQELRPNQPLKSAYEV